MEDSLRKECFRLREESSRFLSMANIFSAEVLIGIKLNLCKHRMWITNGMKMKDELMTDGLRCEEADEFYEETTYKAQ